MSTLIEGVAEAVELAGRLGVDTARLTEAIEGGPLDAPIADAKLHKIEQEDFTPEFPLQWAVKDVDLAIAAADGAALPLLDALSLQGDLPRLADRRGAAGGRRRPGAARQPIPGQRGGFSGGVLLKAASNDACGGSKSNCRRYVSASAAPRSRSMPASSHSTEIGPS